MDYKVLLETEISKGFSRSDLEYLIGLPKNNLSSFLNGKRLLSKKSFLKIERWLTSKDKPDPLNFKISNNDKGNKKDDWLRVATIENDIIIKNIETVVKPIANKVEIASVPLLNKGEFRLIMKGEDGLDYSIAKRLFLNNQ